MGILYPNIVQDAEQAFETPAQIDIVRKLRREHMELHRRIDELEDGTTVIQSGGGMAGSGGGSATKGLTLYGKTITVAVGGWTADTADHPAAPETYYYADLAHGLNSLHARVDHFTDSSGFIWTDAGSFQQPQGTMTLRIWLRQEPSSDMNFYVIAPK